MPTLAGRTLCVLGAGRSGRAAASLALALGARVRLVDERADAAGLDGADCTFGEIPAAALRCDTAVVSPGVPADGALVARLDCPDVVGELGFAARYLDGAVPIAAITGTNGKSTVTAFTAQLLSAAGLRTFAGGNLGTPLSEAVLNPPAGGWQAMAIEVSSYQLELPGAFAPRAAAILNLSPDHLARHGSLERYAEHKCRLFDRLPPGGLAAIPHDPLLERLAAGKPGERRWLGALPGVCLEGDRAVLDGGAVDLSAMVVPGRINRHNAAAACLLARGLGLPLSALDPGALRGLPHRMEPAAEVGGVLWINDSKATNVAATLAALGGLERPAVVLLGGYPKPGSRYGVLAEALERVARAVICFGQTGPAIAGVLGGLGPELVADMAAAVALARTLARPGDCVLLSPACSSFDGFDNFEHRGRVFTELARGEVSP